MKKPLRYPFAKLPSVYSQTNPRLPQDSRLNKSNRDFTRDYRSLFHIRKLSQDVAAGYDGAAVVERSEEQFA